MTRSGIETDLQHSPYKFYKEDFTFYFSSERYRDKYIEALPTAIEAIGISLKHRYGINFKGMDKLAMLLLYWKTEKRGFYLEIKDDPFYNLSDISMNIEQLTLCRKIKEVIESA